MREVKTIGSYMGHGSRAQVHAAMVGEERVALKIVCVHSLLTFRGVLSGWCSSTVKRLSLNKKRKLTNIFSEANHLHLSSFFDTSAPSSSPNLLYQPSNFNRVESTDDDMFALTRTTKWL